jgi:hypothetical protein
VRTDAKRRCAARLSIMAGSWSCKRGRWCESRTGGAGANGKAQGFVFTSDIDYLSFSRTDTPELVTILDNLGEKVKISGNGKASENRFCRPCFKRLSSSFKGAVVGIGKRTEEEIQAAKSAAAVQHHADQREAVKSMRASEAVQAAARSTRPNEYVLQGGRLSSAVEAALSTFAVLTSGAFVDAASVLSATGEVEAGAHHLAGLLVGEARALRGFTSFGVMNFTRHTLGSSGEVLCLATEPQREHRAAETYPAHSSRQVLVALVMNDKDGQGSHVLTGSVLDLLNTLDGSRDEIKTASAYVCTHRNREAEDGDTIWHWQMD